jgi:hypothetical protein
MSRIDPPKDVGVEGGALGMSTILAWLDSLKLDIAASPLSLGVEEKAATPSVDEERPSTLGIELLRPTMPCVKAGPVPLGVE